MAATAQTVAIQQKLNAAGFNLAIDGIAGPKTKAALVAYQKQQGIPASGTADQATVAALLKPVATPKPNPRPPMEALGTGLPKVSLPMPNMRPAPAALGEGSPNNMPRMRNLTLPPLPGMSGSPNFAQPEPEFVPPDGRYANSWRYKTNNSPNAPDFDPNKPTMRMDPFGDQSVVDTNDAGPGPRGPIPEYLYNRQPPADAPMPSGAPDDEASLAKLGLSPDIIHDIMLQRQMQTSDMGQPYRGSQADLKALLPRSPFAPIGGVSFDARQRLNDTTFARTNSVLPKVDLPTEAPQAPQGLLSDTQPGTSLIDKQDAPAFDRFDAPKPQPAETAGGIGLPGMPQRGSFPEAMGDVMGAIGKAIIPSVKGGEAPKLPPPPKGVPVDIWKLLIEALIEAQPGPDTPQFEKRDDYVDPGKPPVPPLMSPMGAYR